MVSSDAQTVSQYLAELEPERKKDMTTLVNLVREYLPDVYQEAMAFGMIGYQVPLGIYVPTHNKLPIGLVAKASQKHGISLKKPPKKEVTIQLRG